MKKFLRIASIVLIVFIAGLFVLYLTQNEKLPEGEPGPDADAMAMRMMTAMNKAAWDSTKSVSWTFRGANHYEWDREEHMVKVSWTTHEVMLNPETMEGMITAAPGPLTEEERQAQIKTAWDYFNNDSFWLAAPFKAFDPGTERSIVTCADGRQGLKVTYTSGGTTPGDSYVWILGEDDRPVAIKMWVSIIPLGGIEFSWENYLTLESGAMVAQDHRMSFMDMNVDLKNISESISR